VTEGYAKPGPRLFPAQDHRIIPLWLELHFGGVSDGDGILVLIQPGEQRGKMSHG